MPRKKQIHMTENLSLDSENIIAETKLEGVSPIQANAVNDGEEKLDSQTLDMLKRVRDQKLVSGGLDPFSVPEKDKDSKFAYKWASTDKDTSESIDYLKEIGWKEVENYRTITTGGYTVNGQPGKHILMRIQKLVYNELLKIQNELNERKKNAVLGSEITFKDGGQNKMGSSTKIDSDFLNT